MTHAERLRAATILGAAALAITDRSASAVASGLAPSASDAAALSTLRHVLDGPTVDQLRRVLGLSHSGTVRLVDRLTRSGLAEREPGEDARSRRVRLTERGVQAADDITATRLDAIDALTSDLSGAERRTLIELLGRVLEQVVATKNSGAWTCRMCDVTCCGRPDGRCPVANAATRRYGSAATGVTPNDHQ